MAKKQEFSEIPEAAAKAGLRIARAVFEKRGNHSEVHLGEEELAVMLSAAFQLGNDGSDWKAICFETVQQRDKLIEANRAFLAWASSGIDGMPDADKLAEAVDKARAAQAHLQGRK